MIRPKQLAIPIDIIIQCRRASITLASLAKSLAKLYGTLKPRLVRKFDTANKANAVSFNKLRSICLAISPKNVFF
jgi:hypothetical protein